jgi:hypothetical protein
MKLSCYIVKDLLPNYLEGLTSVESKNDIEEHLKSCEKCQKEFEIQSNCEIFNESQMQKNIKEVDYLKKYKKKYKTKNIIFFLLGIICANLIIAGIIFLYSQQYNLSGVSRYPSFTIDNTIGTEYICKSHEYKIYTYNLKELNFIKFDSGHIEFKEALTKNKISIHDMIKNLDNKKENQLLIYEFENYQIILNDNICLIAPLNIEVNQVLMTIDEKDI